METILRKRLIAEIGKSLPHDLIHFHILTRVPAKTIGRFRCASTEWRSRLSTSEFAKLHLKCMEQLKAEGIIVGVYPAPHVFCMLRFEVDNFHVQTNMLNLPEGVKWTTICGSANGIVLCRCVSSCFEDCSLNLFNPLTLDTQSVPCIPNIYQYRLGYVKSTDDYKIVAIGWVEIGKSPTVHVYSLAMKNWRFLGSAPYAYLMYEDVCQLNGSFHYVGGKEAGGSFQIVAFSLEDEVFTEVPYPKDLDPFKHFTWGFVPHLTVIRGCLSFMVYSRTGRLSYDLWTMKQYGVRESWVKIVIGLQIPTHIGMHYYYIGVMNDEYLLLRRSDDTLVAVCLENWMPTVLTDYDAGIRVHMLSGQAVFRESLLSPSNSYVV